MKLKRLLAVVLPLVTAFGNEMAVAQTQTRNLMLAQQAYEKKDWDATILHLTKALEANETKGNALLSAGTYTYRCLAYFNVNKFELAVSDCDKALEIKPDPDVYHVRASSLRRLGKFERAIADFTHAIQLKPDVPEHYVSRGIALSDAGNYDQAILDYGKALKLKPSDADIYVVRGMAFRKKKDFDRALIDYQTAVKIDPDLVEGHIGLGLTYRHKRDYERSVASFDKALAIDPLSKDALLCRGIAFADQEQYDLAIRDYSEALKIDPTLVTVYAIRGDAYVRKGSYKFAIADYTTRLRLEPSSNTLYARAWANLYDDDGSAAFDDAQKYLELYGIKSQGEYAAIVGTLGLLKTGRTENTRTFLEHALKQMNAKAWTSQILMYLQGTLSEEHLLSQATDNDKLTTANACVGVNKVLSGDITGGRKHLEWVKANGNRQSSEYIFALAELGRLPKMSQ